MAEATTVRLDFRDPLTPGGLTLREVERVVEAADLAAVPAAVAELEAVWRSGKTAIGYIAYEAAAAFDDSLVTGPPAAGMPLLWFAVGEGMKPTALGAKKGKVPQLRPEWEEADYCATVERVLRAIRDGETYQLNLSFPMTGRLGGGDPATMYAGLMAAQQADFGAFLRTPQWQVLSVSPELFFRLEDGVLESRPMKGTRARGLTTRQDAAVAAELQASEKERAENVMIVDLLRNDVGRLAVPGSVTVPETFRLERYPTVWQMTSRVRGRLRDGEDLAAILAALFPCGSVTGAPKAKTMEWIARTETGPRGVYCGAIGALLPGRQAVFNVPIRTLTVLADGAYRYPVGSGIVADAEPLQEYRECLAKAAVVGRAGMPSFRLLETIRWAPGAGYALLTEHMDRLADSAAYFGWEFEPLAAWQLLLGSEWEQAMRIRLLLAADGSLEAQALPLGESQSGPVRLVMAAKPVDSGDLFLYHKTTRRGVYERARRALRTSEADDVLLYNERGEVTETTIGNLAVRFGEQWYTPPVECGLLAGTYRAAELAAERLRERVITLEALAQADEIAVMNSVRGWQSATLVG